MQVMPRRPVKTAWQSEAGKQIMQMPVSEPEQELSTEYGAGT